MDPTGSVRGIGDGGRRQEAVAELGDRAPATDDVVELRQDATAAVTGPPDATMWEANGGPVLLTASAGWDANAVCVPAGSGAAAPPSGITSQPACPPDTFLSSQREATTQRLDSDQNE